jgi:two-component system, chemotaxis family, chemotaxis protein CheY
MTEIRNIKSATNYRKTVLVVDDQSVALDIHAAILKKADLHLHILTKTNPIEALACVRKIPLDLIVTDFKMDEMDGLQFVQAVKALSYDENVPIIVITAIKDERLHNALLEGGVSACICKPAPAAKLLSLVKQLLENNTQYNAA